MKTINLNGKMLLVPMSAIGEEIRALIDPVDGMQNVLGADIFVYATGNMPERHCCCGGHHHSEDGEHHCCGGHHHSEDGEHHCCGGHHHSEDGEHHCCGGHHHSGDEEHHCCGGHHHAQEEQLYDWDEADETVMDDDDDEIFDPCELADDEEDDDMGALLLVDETLVMVNAEQAYMLGVEVTEDMYRAVPKEGLTLIPAENIDRPGSIPTGPISIRMEE